MSTPVAAICALTEVIHASHATTMIELSKEMEASTSDLQKSTGYSVSETAGCELFTRFISRTHNEAQHLVHSFSQSLGIQRLFVQTL
jgi:translation initiation factor 2B subunit (eIF-2B alpha/beta/delta family)